MSPFTYTVTTMFLPDPDCTFADISLFAEIGIFRLAKLVDLEAVTVKVPNVVNVTPLCSSNRIEKVFTVSFEILIWVILPLLKLIGRPVLFDGTPSFSKYAPEETLPLLPKEKPGEAPLPALSGM